MRLALAFSPSRLRSQSCRPCVVSQAPSTAEAAQTVSFREDFTPGTVVIKHSQRRLYYVVGGGRRSPIRSASAAPASPGSAPAISTASASSRPGRRPPRSSATIRACRTSFAGGSPRQSDGRRGADAVGRRIRHPRHQRAGLDRRLRVVWLHPHAQLRHHGPVRPRRLRHPRGRDALRISLRASTRIRSRCRTIANDHKWPGAHARPFALAWRRVIVRAPVENFRQLVRQIEHDVVPAGQRMRFPAFAPWRLVESA